MYCSLLLCLLFTIHCRAQLPFDDEEADLRSELGLYRDLPEVLGIFKRDTSLVSKQILKAFHNVCLYTEEPELPHGRRKPFIVIEGNHPPSKESIGSKLANLLDGRYIAQLAPCLRRFSNELKGGHPLRRPLQFLSLYATAFDARIQITLDRAVIVNGYWTEQLSYAVTRLFHAGALPPLTADFFHYPNDLMEPDLHIFLDFSEGLYTTTPAVPRFYKISNIRRRTSLKKRKLELYRHLQAMLPIHIHELQRVTNRVTACELLDTLRANLSHTRDCGSTVVLNYPD